MRKQKLIIIGLVILIAINLFSNIYSEEIKAPLCIEAIPPTFDPKADPCIDGFQLDGKQNWCSYTINSDAVSSGSVVIEVIQGGRYDNGRNLYLNIDKMQTLNLFLDRETTPTYILCYDTDRRPATDGSVGWTKESLIQSMVVGKGDGFEGHSLPEDILADNSAEINNNLYYLAEKVGNGADNLLNLGINSTVDVNKSYYNIDKEDVTTKWLLGLLFALIGMMLFFDSFFNNRFIRYI